jgi:hypothetical protein
MAPYAAQLSYLNGYSNVPETFAAYERNKIAGSQFKGGITHAEQNHADIIARLGPISHDEPHVMVQRLLTMHDDDRRCLLIQCRHEMEEGQGGFLIPFWDTRYIYHPRTRFDPFGIGTTSSLPTRAAHFGR